MSAQNWPVILKQGDITLRPLRIRDRGKWDHVRSTNRSWLSPWEATMPRVPGEKSERKLPTYFSMVAAHNKEGRSGRSISLAIWYQGALVGQISLGGIIYGALRGAHIGYWIDTAYANRGLVTSSVEMLTQFAFDELKLHRIEINIRPENDASRKVAEKSGYHLEGERPRFLHIDGQWRDHLSFVRENPNIS